MRLWTVQPVHIYENLLRGKVFSCEPAKSEWITEVDCFKNAYDWLVEQMKKRVGEPPAGIDYPIWAYHTIDWKHKKPDLRFMAFCNYTEPMACIEIEIPDKNVLLSDLEDWHSVLNKILCSNSMNEEEWEQEKTWFESLLPSEKDSEIRKSWERIFDIFPPIQNDWCLRGRSIQATFWELQPEQVVDARIMRRIRKK